MKKPVYGGTFPFPRSVNSYYNGRKVLSKEGREYKKAMQLPCIVHGLKNLRLSDRLSVHITLHHSKNCKYDIDNFVKSLLDSFTEAGVWEDDSQIDHLTIVRGEKRKGGEAVVNIVPIRK